MRHFNQLKGHQFFVKDSDIQDLHKQVSVAQNFSKQLNASGMSEESAIGGMFAGYGGLGISSFTTGAMLGGGLTMGGLAGMVVLGGLVAGPALAILGAMSADKMKEKLEKVKAYYSQVEKAVKKADAIIDQFQAIEKMAKLFTRQITKCDALFFSLSQDAIATMKKHNYNRSLYSQEERDQLCVAVSTLMTLSAFLKIPIIDKHQKLQEKAKRALEIMKKQMDSLESGHYDAKMIQSRQKDLENLFKKGSPGGLKDKGF
ncbi:sortase [Helicobacter pylori]|nr:sortase [Helicobacter pylori]